ncbi:MAG: succinate--CoA ligase subunit alpha [candidate division Zixibacteria bacterium]|nr:succinate--CoA ligase subunit alpha [candidate division Zixibacteria bacterium]
MAVLLDRKSKVMVQGIADGDGLFQTERMCNYGTNIVGGVSPCIDGQKAYDRPVFNTVKECVDYTRADTSVIFLPAELVKEASIDAIQAGIKLIVVIPKDIPADDMLNICQEAKEYGARILGSNTAGIITPDQAILGTLPDNAFAPGSVGTVTCSSSIMYYVADMLTRSGHGQSTCVCLGEDPILGLNFAEILSEFEDDPETKAVVMTVEDGGVYKKAIVDQIKSMKTPVLAMIGGVNASKGKQIEQAGAIVDEETDTAEEKLAILEAAGAHICKTFTDIPKTLVLEEARI